MVKGLPCYALLMLALGIASINSEVKITLESESGDVEKGPEVEHISPIIQDHPEEVSIKENTNIIENSVGADTKETSNKVTQLTDDDSHIVRLETVGTESVEPIESSKHPVTNDTTNSNNETLSTSNENNTIKVFPKRVKCLPRKKYEQSKVVKDQPNELLENDKSAHLNEGLDVDISYPDEEVFVEIVNGTQFLKLMSERHNPNITNRSTEGECSLVIFYAPWCPFSASAAPSFNGLARLYPDVALYAVDSSKYQSINTQFGILALPTLIIFHNTKPISKFNQSDYMLENFSKFVNTFTGLEPALPVKLMDRDMEGPVPTKAVPEPDYYLYLAWTFTIICALGYFGKSSYCEWIVESVRNNWREAEIQHEHID